MIANRGNLRRHTKHESAIRRVETEASSSHSPAVGLSLILKKRRREESIKQWTQETKKRKENSPNSIRVPNGQDRLETLYGESSPVLDRSSVVVSSLVAVGIKELMRKVSIRCTREEEVARRVSFRTKQLRKQLSRTRSVTEAYRSGTRHHRTLEYKSKGQISFRKRKESENRGRNGDSPALFAFSAAFLNASTTSLGSSRAGAATFPGVPGS